MIDIFEFESNPVIFNSDCSHICYYIDIISKRNIDFDILTNFNTPICSQKKPAHAYIFQDASKITIFCHNGCFMVGEYPAVQPSFHR
jgi:hypothetical protein